MKEKSGLWSNRGDQHRELMPAESDLDLAFRLQMEEAMAASLIPSSSAPIASSSSQPVVPTAADRGGGNANQSLAHVIHLQALELSRYQLETRDRNRPLAEVRMAVEDIRHQAHDERFAREMSEIPDDEWEEYVDEFKRPIEAAGVADEPNFRLYFKGMSNQHVSKGALIKVAAVAVAVFDCRDNLVLKIRKPVRASALASCREALEAKALVEGLNAVFSLGIKRIDVFFDYKTLFNHVKGIWVSKRIKVSNEINEVQGLMRKFEICEIFLVPRCRIQRVFRLTREAMDSQTSKNVVELGGSKVPRETCNICLEVLSSSGMFSMEECLHRFCLSCMKQYVEIKLHDGILPACPRDGCKVMLDIEGARKFLPSGLLELMSQHLKEASIPATEKAYCPYPMCSALMSKSEAICSPQQAHD